MTEEYPPTTGGDDDESATTMETMRRNSSATTATTDDLSSYDSDYELPLPSLGTCGLMSLLLAPDLHETITPDTLLLADNVALFRLLPLLLAAIARVAQRPDLRDHVVQLVQVLRMRICACRGIKLRFLLLVKTKGYASMWGNVILGYRAGGYAIAQANLEMRAEAVPKERASVDLNELRREVSALIPDLLSNRVSLTKFAMNELFNPEHGLEMRTHKYRLRKIHKSFYADEVIDWLIERLGLPLRKKGVQIGERLRKWGLISRVGQDKPFADDHHLYISQASLYQEDNLCSRLFNCKGESFPCTRMKKKSCPEPPVSEHPIRSISLKIPVDMIDLQSVGFWSKTIFDKSLNQGDKFDFRLVAHPLLCRGMDLAGNFKLNEKYAANNGDLSTGSGFKRGDSGSTTYSGERLLSAEQITPSDLSYSSEMDSMSLADNIFGNSADGIIIGSVKVAKVFSSIARPKIVSLRRPLPEAAIEKDEMFETVLPRILVKEGDNLLQDMSVQLMFHAFNNIWHRCENNFCDRHQAPFILCYDVFPTDTQAGFMEAVEGLESLKNFDWQKWKREVENKPVAIDNMIRSAAGSYIGAYVLGARDRHFDNMMIKDGMTFFHIDFGFLLGSSPPIDGPRFSIAPAMEQVLRELGQWDEFVKTAVQAFLALRRSAPAIVRTATMLFAQAGHPPAAVKDYLRGRHSLNVRAKTRLAARHIRDQLFSSSTDWKARLKSYSHEKIDPVFYGLLEKRFPPAMLAMKIVNMNEHKADKKLALASGRSEASAEETITL